MGDTAAKVDPSLLNPGFSEVRLRFAPSPTGYLHVGGARTALFNYLFARAYGGKFVLRIEDTDQVRSTAEATEQVLESMDWLGIDWDEGPDPDYRVGKPLKPDRGDFGPYFQAKRLSLYQKAMDGLVAEKKAYPCFCSDEELNQKRQRQEAIGLPYVYDGKCAMLSESEVANKRDKFINQGKRWVYRFKVKGEELIFDDEVKGKIKFDLKLIGDFVIQKSDGFPTYNFAVVVDDSSMKISHVLRGDDHISNTPRQVLIYQALGQPIPKFYHISMILGEDGAKLSKRHGAVSVLDFKQEGYYPSAMLNHLALLGWSPEDGVEVISREDLNKAFMNPKFSSSPAIFDVAKLNYLNGLYIRNLADEVILTDFKKVLAGLVESEQGTPHLEYLSEGLKHPKLDEILLLLRNHCKKLADITEEFISFVQPNIDGKLKALAEEDKSWINSEESKKLFALAREVFGAKAEPFLDEEEFKQLNKRAKEDLQIKGKNFFMPLRIKLMGSAHGVELNQFLNLKYRREIIERLED